MAEGLRERDMVKEKGEKERWIKEKEREKEKRRKGEKRDQQSWFHHQPRWWDVIPGSVIEANDKIDAVSTAQDWGTSFLWVGFPAWKWGFLLCMPINCHAQSIFSDLSGIRSEALWWFLHDLDSALQPLLTSWLYSYCFAVLCCVSLQELEQGCLFQRSGVLPLHGPLLQSQVVLSDVQLLPIVLGSSEQLSHVFTRSPWLTPQPRSYQSLRHKHSAGLFPAGILHLCCSRGMLSRLRASQHLWSLTWCWQWATNAQGIPPCRQSGTQSLECPPEVGGMLAVGSLSPAESMDSPLAALHWPLAKGLCLARGEPLVCRSSEALASVPLHLGLLWLAFPFGQFCVTSCLGQVMDSVIFPLLRLLLEIPTYSRRKYNWQNSRMGPGIELYWQERNKYDPSSALLSRRIWENKL